MQNLYINQFQLIEAGVSDYRVVVSTCDKYLPYLKPFIHQFNTYYGKDQQVLVAGFSKPDFIMPRNFHFHSIGNQEDYLINKWSNSIIDLCNQIQDETFVFMLEDYWITDKVDIEGVQLLVDYARLHPKVVRIDLTPDRLHTARDQSTEAEWKGGKLGHLNMVRSKSGLPYSLAMITSVWNKSNILRVLEPEWNPWEVEMQGSYNTYLQGDDMEVWGTESNPVPHCVGIRRLKGKDGELWCEAGFFKQEDRERMQILGILGETGFF